MDDEVSSGLMAARRLATSSGVQFWLFTLYGKDEASDLSPDQRKALKGMLEEEPGARKDL